MGPLEMMYGWQAVLCAVACVGITQLVKTIIDTVYDARWKKMDDAAQKAVSKSLPPPGPGPYRKSDKPLKMGTVVRRQSVIVTRFALPMTPILVGFAYACLVPLRPEALAEYVEAQSIEGAWAVLANGAWGAAVGQFSTYLYSTAKKTMASLAKRAEG